MSMPMGAALIIRPAQLADSDVLASLVTQLEGSGSDGQAANDW